MKKAFTLIELLVVIAIIGILAGIVLTSVRGARNRAYDAEIKSEIQQIRMDAEMYYDDKGTYLGFQVPAQYVPPKCSGQATYTIDVVTDSIAIFCKLCTDNTKWWCMDSTGKATTTATDPLATADGLCP